MEFPIKNKIITKNKSPNNKKEYYSKILNRKDYKNNNQKINHLNYNFDEKKSTSKINLFDKNKTKNYIRKKTPTNKSKKKQIKKKLKEREPSSLKSNLSINKIINPKEIKNNKGAKQSSSITTDSAISFVSNTSNKMSNKISNNKCISLLNKNESSKRNRIDSDVSNNSSSKRNFYNNNKEKKEINEGRKIFNLSNNINNKKNISKNDIKGKDFSQNKKMGIIKTKIIRNFKNENNIIELPKKEDKSDIKKKDINNNMIINKGVYNIMYNQNINNKNLFINKNSAKQKTNKKLNDKKYSYAYNDKIINSNNNNNNNNNNLISCNLNQLYYTEIKNPNNYNNRNNLIDKQTKNKNDIYGKIKLNPVKKSLFSEHMNFLINHNQEEKNIYYNIDSNNNNIIKFPFNNILDSTDKKDYESKFINYDLGKTTGTSLSKESFFLFGNIEKNKNSKKSKLPKKQNLEINLEEKERSQEELEKLAKEYINMSKYWENRDDYYKQKINQTSTITTVIDDNNSFDDTIL